MITETFIKINSIVKNTNILQTVIGNSITKFGRIVIFFLFPLLNGLTQS